MRPHIFVRPVRPEDSEDFLQWSLANKDKNGFDPEAPLHKSSFTIAAYTQSGVQCYIPVQRPYLMEGIAPRPDADKTNIAICLKECVQFLVSQAQIQGVGEIYFLGTEEGTDAMAENHVFEKLNYKIYRLKIKDTESKP